MGLLEQILENQNEILLKLKQLEKSISNTKGDDTSFITTKDIIKDLGISMSTFHRYKNEMPFLMKVGGSSSYKARRCDFELWKKSNIPQS